MPDLVTDLEGPLAHLGRPDLIAQVKAAVLELWSYDEFANALYLHLSAEEPVDMLSLWDELGLNLELDSRGRLCRIEILDGKDLAQRLERDAR
jgi:uncharacterized protein YuzE